MCKQNAGQQGVLIRILARTLRQDCCRLSPVEKLLTKILIEFAVLLHKSSLDFYLLVSTLRHESAVIESPRSLSRNSTDTVLIRSQHVNFSRLIFPQMTLAFQVYQNLSCEQNALRILLKIILQKFPGKYFELLVALEF